MNTSFKCENCGSVTSISSRGIISIVCQDCGCSEVKFQHDVILTPVNFGDVQEPQLAKVGESFLGKTLRGRMWDLSFPNPVTNPPPILASPEENEEEKGEVNFSKLLSRKKNK